MVTICNSQKTHNPQIQSTKDTQIPGDDVSAKGRRRRRRENNSKRIWGRMDIERPFFASAALSCLKDHEGTSCHEH
jgi:hypothetical protein